MKYITSFRTTVRLVRYLFRALAILLWILGALLSLFYAVSQFHSRESDIRQDFNLNFAQAQSTITHAVSMMRDIRYTTENRLSWMTNSLDIMNSLFSNQENSPVLLPIFPNSNCVKLNEDYHHALSSLGNFIHYWKENFRAAYDLNRVFVIGTDSLCLANFNIRPISTDRKKILEDLRRYIVKLPHRVKNKKELAFWVTPGGEQGSMGTLYLVSPVYSGNHLDALVGTDQNIRLEDLIIPSHLPIGVTLLDEKNNVLLSHAKGKTSALKVTDLPNDESYFGYDSAYNNLLLKKRIYSPGLTIVYSLSSTVLMSSMKLLLLNLLLLNLLSAGILFVIVLLLERKMFPPEASHACHLEEDEEFNHKVISCAPVGISILQIKDGRNILSNALARHYISLFAGQDWSRLRQAITQPPIMMDVITRQDQHLQIRFVQTRYRNEDVAICVMVDVSERVKMETSLQEMASAAEQSSQSKSMFLATVSHELRTPLYGIMGNLALLQTQSLPEEAQRLLTVMDNSSNILLKIINDILDFSKIESEQLKIELGSFIPRKMISQIVNNYLPLVVRKRLVLYCFIDPEVPESLMGDTVRIQQILTNLLSNAIKFTDTGCIIVQVTVVDCYLELSIRDTGVGIHASEVVKLFEPFSQVGVGVQRYFQGTGLGLAICEKLVTLMDGDIFVSSEPGIGSLFGIRIPLFQAQPAPLPMVMCYQGMIWLAIHNTCLEEYLLKLLHQAGANVQLMSKSGQGETEGLLISDHKIIPSGSFSTQILLSAEYLGSARLNGQKEWIVNVAFCFELLVLLARIDAPQTFPSLPSEVLSSRQDSSDIRILVVDDHPITRRLLSDQLASIGYSCVSTANDGLEALTLLANQSIDIVLTDVNMPEMDGYRLTQHLRQQGFHGTIIGVTANALAQERMHCIAIGMDNCLSKPLTVKELSACLAHFSQQIRVQRKLPVV